ncbi:MAG: hypothetical protein ABSC41_08855 [Acidimicrobiales bacterium]
MLEPIIPCDYRRGHELAALRTELQRCWCAETSFWPGEWTPDRPSFGQCAVTAMIVREQFGGEILRTINEGVIHYWNRVDDIEVDLTRDQFDTWAPEDEIVAVDPDHVGSSGPSIAARYSRLTAALGS